MPGDPAGDREDTARGAKPDEGWYRRQAGRVFVEHVQVRLPRFTQHSLALVTLSIRRVQTRWDSCRARGANTLNSGLMQVPTPYIDYVIAHELAWLVEHNHGPRFYALLDRVMRDWRERRQGLNGCEVG